MLLIVDLVLLALVTQLLCLAVWRGRARARRTRTGALPSDLADLIPGRAVPGRAVPGPGRRPSPSVATDPVTSRASWSASAERGETAASRPTVAPVAATAATPRAERPVRPAVVVEPRETRWVVRRDGASRVSSVHDSRQAAEARAAKTARRERVVLEVRDGDERVVDRVDYAVDRSARPRDDATAPRS